MQYINIITSKELQEGINTYHLPANAILINAIESHSNSMNAQRAAAANTEYENENGSDFTAKPIITEYQRTHNKNRQILHKSKEK